MTIRSYIKVFVSGLLLGVLYLTGWLLVWWLNLLRLPAVSIVARQTACPDPTVHWRRASGQLNILGISQKGAVLNVSPNGRWMLSWDGVTQNTPSTNPGDRLLWNLQTGQSHDWTVWSKRTELYDDQCGWTPDNRIYDVHNEPQPLGEGNWPFSPSIYIQNPDGSGKVLCHDSHKTYDYGGNDVSDILFSPDGGQLYVLTGDGWRHFDARSGRMISRYAWHRTYLRGQINAYDIDGYNEANYAVLSSDGKSLIISLSMKKTRHVKVLARHWVLVDPQTGRVQHQLPHDPSLELAGCDQLGFYAGYGEKKNTMGYYRLSDGKEVSRYIIPKTGDPPLKKLVQYDDLTGKPTLSFQPPQGQWQSLAATPDHHTIYGLSTQDKIYKFDNR